MLFTYGRYFDLARFFLFYHSFRIFIDCVFFPSFAIHLAVSINSPSSARITFSIHRVQYFPADVFASHLASSSLPNMQQQQNCDRKNMSSAVVSSAFSRASLFLPHTFNITLNRFGNNQLVRRAVLFTCWYLHLVLLLHTIHSESRTLLLLLLQFLLLLINVRWCCCCCTSVDHSCFCKLYAIIVELNVYKRTHCSRGQSRAFLHVFRFWKHNAGMRVCVCVCVQAVCAQHGRISCRHVPIFNVHEWLTIISQGYGSYRQRQICYVHGKREKGQEIPDRWAFYKWKSIGMPSIAHCPKRSSATHSSEWHCEGNFTVE